MSTNDFAARLRNRRTRSLGYWSVIDSPVSTEWLAHIGWDYIALDLQHGLIGYDGMLRGLTAIDAAHGPAGLVRVEANDMTPIGRALDAGRRRRHRPTHRHRRRRRPRRVRRPVPTRPASGRTARCAHSCGSGRRPPTPIATPSSSR